MMKRCLSLFLAVALIVVLAVPVSADEGNEGGWIDLLETATVNDSGNNLITTAETSTFFRIKTPQYMRLTKMDMILTHPSGQAPKAVKVRYNGGFYTLTMVKLDAYTTRVYGDNIPDTLYADVVIELVRYGTSTATYEILSCRVTPLVKQDFPAEGTLSMYYGDPSPLALPNSFTVEGDGSVGAYEYKLIPVAITDWRKYDSVTIFGSISQMALNSFRAAIGNKGLPYDISYMESIPTGTDSQGGFFYEYVSGTETNYYNVEGVPDEFSHEEGAAAGEDWNSSVVTYGGAVLYTITIDLRGIDRNTAGNLNCYFTCVANPGIGYAFNVQNVSGSIETADTTEITWWTRFTNFMNDLFGSKDSGALDDLESSSDSISDNASQIHDFEQSQQAVLDNNFAQIQGAITFTNFATALVFVQKYTNMTFNGISQYAIIFTLPLFLGLFFYLCSRIPGITRWKSAPPRSTSPRSKGGGKT